MINLFKTGFLLAGVLFFSNASIAQDIRDAEIKKNVTDIERPLYQISRLEPRVFEYNKDNFKSLQLPSGKQFGFMTDNVQDIFPGLVTVRNVSYPTGKNSTRTARIKTIDTEALIPLLVASIKEQQTEIEKLKAAIEQLKKNAKP